MESVYTKDEIKNSEKFRHRRDAVEALLDEDACYSIEEAEEILERFMEGSV